MVEAQNTEALQSGKMELKDKLKEKRTLEIMIHSLLNTVIKKKAYSHSHFERWKTTKWSHQEMLMTA